jgi:hypothetical protein
LLYCTLDRPCLTGRDGGVQAGRGQLVEEVRHRTCYGMGRTLFTLALLGLRILHQAFAQVLQKGAEEVLGAGPEPRARGKGGSVSSISC